MELSGLEPRRSDLARGIVIARSATPLEGAAQRAMWELLAKAGVIELESESTELDDPQPARRWHAAPWLPPSPSELDAHRTAIEEAARVHELEAVWCFKVETGIDGVAWLDLASSEPLEEVSDEPAESEIVDAIFDAPAEVLYAAPDAPATAADDEEDDGDEDDEETDEELEAEGIVESHWRNGAPPFEHAVPFPKRSQS